MCINSPNLHLPKIGLSILIQVDIDGKMGVDIAHLVLEALGDADDEVVDEGAHGAQGRDVLAVAVVHLDVDDVLRRVREADAQVAQVLAEFAPWAFDCDVAGFDLDFYYAEAVLVCSHPMYGCRLDACVVEVLLAYAGRMGSRRTALWNDQLLFRVDCPHFGRVLAGMRWWCWAMRSSV